MGEGDWWVEVGAWVSEEAVEAVAEALRGMGASGVIIRPWPNGVQVSTFFPPSQNPERKRRRLERFLGRLSSWGLEPGPGKVWTKVWEPREWEEAWKAHFSTRRLEIGVWFVPTWEWEEQRERIPEGETVVLLEPGLAFGTGEHPTTQLCAELLAEHLRGGEFVVDVGTGSGILAILAARRGARKVVGIDIDPLAVQAARENVRRNGVAERVEVRLGSFLDGEKGIEVLVANLTTALLEEMAPQLPLGLKPKALVIASGMSLSNQERAQKALEAVGVRIEEVRQREGWVALQGRWEPQEKEGRAPEGIPAEGCSEP